MRIITIQANPSGSRPGLQDWNSATPPEGYAFCPDEFVDVFYSTTPAGFVNITVDGDIVTAMEINQEALDAYLVENPPADPTESIRAEKESEMSAECKKAIVAGMDVETTQGIEHFSLEETDQINLTTALAAVQDGATEYPYHADGELCRMFSAAEIQAISNAAVKHKLYHTTLCNHILTWVRRAETVEELNSITYSVESLPEDLAANMASILASA